MASIMRSAAHIALAVTALVGLSATVGACDPAWSDSDPLSIPCELRRQQAAKGNVFVLASILMVVTAVASAFLDNVTTMLLIIPVTIEIALTLKINPKPTAASTALATFDDLEDAGRAVSEITRSGILPSVMEILGRETLQAINQNTDLHLPEVDAMLLAETDGYTRGETDYQMQKILRIFRDNRAKEVKEAKTDEEARRLRVTPDAGDLSRQEGHGVLGEHIDQLEQHPCGQGHRRKRSGARLDRRRPRRRR